MGGALRLNLPPTISTAPPYSSATLCVKVPYINCNARQEREADSDDGQASSGRYISTALTSSRWPKGFFIVFSSGSLSRLFDLCFYIFLYVYLHCLLLAYSPKESGRTRLFWCWRWWCISLKLLLQAHPWRCSALLLCLWEVGEPRPSNSSAERERQAYTGPSRSRSAARVRRTGDRDATSSRFENGEGAQPQKKEKKKRKCS